MDGQGHQGQGNDSNPLELLYVGFNQDSACFAVGTSAGFRVYNCEPFRETFCRGFSNGGIGVVAMLFRCQVLAIVGGGAFPKYPPNKVMIWDDHQAKCIGELSFRTQVRSVRLRRDMVVVALEHRVLVYAFADLRLLLQVETLSNPQGLVAVSCDADSTVLACLGLHPGQVRIELYDRHQTKFIDAHTSSLQAMSLSLDGRRLATASQKGTLIRVWSTADRQLLHELRRGADPACIYSLALSRDSNWLAATSDKGTVHVFGLGPNHHHHTSSGAAGDGSTGTAGSSGKGRAAGSEQQQGGGSGRGGASAGGDAGSVTEVAGSPDERGAHGSGQQGTPQSRTGSSGGGLFGFVKSSLSGLVPALPAAISPLLPKYFHSEWSFAQFRLPDDKCRGKVLVGFGSDPGVLYLITSGGSFYKVVFDTVKGGVAQQVDWANFLVPSSMGSA